MSKLAPLLGVEDEARPAAPLVDAAISPNAGDDVCWDDTEGDWRIEGEPGKLLACEFLLLSDEREAAAAAAEKELYRRGLLAWTGASSVVSVSSAPLML